MIRPRVRLLLLLSALGGPASGWLAPSPLWAAISRVQGVNNGTSVASTSYTVTINGVGAGDFLALAISYDSNTASVSSITSSPANTFTKVRRDPHATAAQSEEIWFAANVASGNTTITINSSASVDSRCFVEEYSGVATSSPLDQQAGANGTSTTPATGSMSTDFMAELMFCGVSSSGSNTFTAGTNYTLLQNTSFEADEHQILTGTTTQTGSFTLGNSLAWVLSCATFKPSAGPVSFVGTAICTAFNAASGTVTRTQTAGDDVVVTVAIRTTTSTVSSVTDTGSSTYAARGPGINNGTVARMEIWSARNAAASTSVTVNLGASSKFVACVGEYSGVAALGATSTATGATTTPTIALTTQDANNFVVAGFAAQGTATFSANVGALRGSTNTTGGSASTNIGGALNDNGAATASSVTNTATLSASNSWAAEALELRSTTGAVPLGGSKRKKLEVMDGP